MSTERCTCGDTECPWCGTAQGYSPKCRAMRGHLDHPEATERCELDAEHDGPHQFASDRPGGWRIVEAEGGKPC